MLQVIRSVAPLWSSPDSSSTQTSQCLLGEQLELLERMPGFYAVRNLRDEYIGYLRADHVTNDVVTATHLVHCRSTPVFSDADIKSPILQSAPFSSELSAKRHDERFLRTTGGGFVVGSHCSALPLSGSAALSVAHSAVVSSDTKPIGCGVAAQGRLQPPDLVTVAESLFAGSPYIWGGRSPAGCDCSGLVQLAAFALGYRLPRDSGPQEHAITNAVGFSARQRNDIVFWPGHVGILKDPDTLLHATAHSMLTVSECLTAVIERAGPVSSVRRL